MSIPPVKGGLPAPDPAPEEGLWRDEDLKGREGLSFPEEPTPPAPLNADEFFDQLGFFGGPLPTGNKDSLNQKDPFAD